MTQRLRRSMLIAVLMGYARAAGAQWVVYDPTNWAQAVTTYAQAVQQYEFFLRQARRLPPAVVNRYRVPETAWGTYDPSLPVLAGLNTGLGIVGAYRDTVDELDSIADVLIKTPGALRPRLTARYGTIGMADNLARLGMQQAGTVRANGPSVLRAIQALEDDALAAPDEYHSQTALLNKINGASVLGLRIAEQGTQFLGHTVEQLLLDNLRKRQAEAQAMNAQAYQWRYGARYGAEMFEKTADHLDAWRQP